MNNIINIIACIIWSGLAIADTVAKVHFKEDTMPTARLIIAEVVCALVYLSLCLVNIK